MTAERGYNPLGSVELCHRDLDDDGLSCHLPENHNGPCAADLFEHLAERAAYGRTTSGEHSAVGIDVVVLEAVAWWAEEQITRMARLAESEAHAWSYAHCTAVLPLIDAELVRLSRIERAKWWEFRRRIWLDGVHTARQVSAEKLREIRIAYWGEA